MGTFYFLTEKRPRKVECPLFLAFVGWPFLGYTQDAEIGDAGQVRRVAPGPAAAAVGVEMSASEANDGPDLGELFQRAPVRTILAGIAFVNLCVFFAVSALIGGDASGTSPSQQGFVVTSHGRQTAVTEGVWLFSLCYEMVTATLSPLVFFLLIVAATQPYRWKGGRRYLFLILAFVWAALWYYGVIRNGSHSILDYLSMNGP
jgi:hypothetical protein